MADVRRRRPGDRALGVAAREAYILDALREEQERKRAAGTPAAASFGELLRNPTIWLLIAINFCYQVGIYGYTMWLPTLLKNLTHTGMGKIGLLAMLPYVAMVIGMFVTSYLSDRTGKRRLFVLLPLVGFAACRRCRCSRMRRWPCRSRS